MSVQPFHLAIPVSNLETSRTFYRETLGLKEGRSSDHWVDFDFFGHQLVIHLSEKDTNETPTNNVDGKNVPVPHFGVVLTPSQFKSFETRLRSKNISFVIEPYTRFEGLPGEQRTMFFKDPCDNALEFKSFQNINQLFAS